MNSSPIQQGSNGGAARYPLIRGSSLSQPPSYHHIEPQVVPRLTSNLLSYPQVEPQYEAQRTAYAPRLNYGLQGPGHDMYASPTLHWHEQRPSTLLSAYPQGPYERPYNDDRAVYPPLTSGISAYMPQQAPADSATGGRAWVTIENGGVDLRRSLPPMTRVISTCDIVVEFPDYTTKIVRARNDSTLTLGMAVEVVQKWYERNTDRSGSQLKGFRVRNGVYVARVV